MSQPPSRPGPRDGSRRLVIILAGVVVALLAYIIKLIVAPGLPPQNALVWIAVGIILGVVAMMIRPAKRGKLP